MTEYNPEKKRLLRCPNCQVEVIDFKPSMNCPNCGTNMITVVKVEKSKEEIFEEFKK